MYAYTARPYAGTYTHGHTIVRLWIKQWAYWQPQLVVAEKEQQNKV